MRKRNNSAKVNYIYNLTYQILNVIMPLATAPYLSRVIGPSGIGVFSYTSSIASYFAMIGMLGLTNYGSRTIAMHYENSDYKNKIFSSLVYIQVGLSLLMCVFYASYVALLVEDNQLISWIQGLVVAGSIINLNWFFWGIQEFRITVTRSFFIKIISFILIFAIVKNSDDLWKYTLIMALGSFAGFLPLVFIAKKYVRLVRVSFKEIMQHLVPNIILFIPFLSMTLYRTIDKVMLGWLANYNQVGYYENADKIIIVCMGCITALGQVMLPKVSNLMAKGKVEECTNVINKSLKFSTYFASAIAFGIISVSDYFVPVFFGSSFMNTIGVLTVLAPTFLLLAWSNVFNTQIIMPRAKDKIYLVATLLGVVTNIVFNLMLIPVFNANGAAIATLFTELVIFTYTAYSIRNEIGIWKLMRGIIKYLYMGFIMFVLLFIIKQSLVVNIQSLCLLIGIGVAIYMIESLVLAVVYRDDFIIEMMNTGLKIFHIKKRF